MARIRYNILVMTSSKGKRKADFIANRQPLRPGSINDGLDEVVNEQYNHMGFGVMVISKLTKLIVKGLRFKGKGVDGTDIVFMYCPTTRVATVIKVVRA